MDVQVRHDIEQQIARAAVKSLASAGYKISVFDGEAFALAKTDDVSAILDAMFCTDGDVLYVYTPPTANNESWERIGFVELIYGNSGWDVISDHSSSLESVLHSANALAEKLEREHA
ncbi:hypothetical protein LZ656_17560 [Leclercia adecarboxylata]|uniref:hypothetical protein n=1 Tax=Leclercia adecarboxylata TaxID=83655 RepID=UPI000980B947|nr:hypothetical protein [Leclercia adecarboxylata]MCE9984182.1 hypothetical protein [Leclercia adecarboxylata]OOB84400.1 hypothetical protein BZY71_25005 [Leclercia adecarboxylata]